MAPQTGGTLVESIEKIFGFVSDDLYFFAGPVAVLAPHDTLSTW